MIRVDLASKEVVRIAKANRLIDRLRLASVMVLLGFGLAAAVVYGMFFYTSRRATVVGEDIVVVSGQIDRMAESEVWYRRLLVVAEESGRVLSLQKDFAGVLLDVYDLLPEGVMIEAVRFEGEVVVVEVRTVGVQAMARGLAVLSTVTAQDGARFDEVALGMVRRNDQGEYVLRVELGLKEAI